jgi:Tfp pilus assembly protein FimT
MRAFSPPPESGKSDGPADGINALSTPAAAFTLVELLVVVAVIVIMMTLAIPAFNAIRGGTDFTSEVYDISNTLEQSRAYAMANNTYVMVGIGEYAASQSSSASPQSAGTGRVAIAVIASKDGTQPYRSLLNSNPNTLATWPTVYGSGGAFVAVTKVMTFQNLHLADLQSTSQTLPTSGNMARPAVSAYYDIGNTSTAYNSATPFAWPLGARLAGSPQPQYTFNKVIEFDPQGSARIISTTNLNAIPYCIEIGLQPTHGVTAIPLASTTSGQIAAIQIDGMSGATRTYRP